MLKNTLQINLDSLEYHFALSGVFGKMTLNKSSMRGKLLNLYMVDFLNWKNLVVKKVIENDIIL